MAAFNLFSVNETSNYNEISNKLAEEQEVLSVEANNKVSILGFSNDPFSDTQWYIDNQGKYANLSAVMKTETLSTKNIDMDVVEAWGIMAGAGVTDKEVVIAVIDTGVDINHPDLAENMWINYDEIPGDNNDNDNNGYIDDVYGWDFYNSDNTVSHYNDKNMASKEDNDNHGTHIAGIIAAVANNSTGIAGIASNINIKIMPLKINGGKDGVGDTVAAIEAVKYAEMMGADICNMSWGTGMYSAGLEKAMRESDMLFVAAAGNTGNDNDRKPIYPASYDLDNLISVTFIDADGEMTGYSDYGTTSVDLAAPGEDIYSTIVGGYGRMSGSSMAAPQVTAVAALLYAYKDHLYASNVKEILTSNIKELPDLNKVIAYGGIPSAYKAVMAANKLLQDKEAPMISLATIYSEDEMLVPVDVEDVGTSKLRVVKWIFGEKTVEDFQHGTNGTSIVDNKVNLSKAGVYTFYAADYAGNEIAQTYVVADDVDPPQFTAVYTVASNYKTRAVMVSAGDEQSGLKRVEYMAGIKKVEEFLPANAGTEVKLQEGKGKFKVKKDGVYTIFVSDYRGNMSVKPIIIRTRKATDFKLLYQDKTILIGDQFTLRKSIKPADSTDRITYTSSDEEVATVSITGKVTGIAQGKAYITATTASGLASECFVIIKPKLS